MNILGTGLSGLVGSRFVDLYTRMYEFSNLDLTAGVDITDETQVMRAVKSSDSPVLIHMAAFTDATKAFEQTNDTNGLCYKVNVIGTRNIAKAAAAYGKHLIHVSTAFVFDGKKETMYIEDDPVNPIEWYGVTKVKAEEIVQQICPTGTIFRIDQPFRCDVFPKQDTAHKMAALLAQGKIHPFADHWFAPTIIEDFAKVLDWAIRTKPQGIYHATCNQKISDLEFAQMIIDALDMKVEITPGSLTEYLKTSTRPYQQNTALNSDKLMKITDIALTPLQEAIKNIQIAS